MRDRRSTALLIVAGILVSVVVGVVTVPARAWLGPANIALLLVIVVVAAAATGRRIVALATALAGALVFDVLHTEPYGSLAIARRQEVITVVLVLVVGIAVAEVATWGRRQRTTAERTVSDVSILRSVAEVAAEGEEPEYVVITAAYWLRQLLDLTDCRLEHGRRDPNRAVLTTSGEVTVGPVVWDTESGMPPGEIDLTVRGDGREIGRFVLAARTGAKVHPDRLLTAVALADLVGVCLAGNRGDLDRDT